MMLSWLSKRAPELQGKLSAGQAKDADAKIDADLMLLYASPTAALARALSKGDRQVLSDWRTKVRLAQHEAKQQAAQLEHGPVQSALVDSVIAWRRVNAALREVLLNRGAAA